MQVPEGWKYNGLDCLAANDRPAIKAGPFGSSLKKEFYVKSGYKVYGQEQVIANDAFLGDYFIDQEKYDELSSCSVQAGDILISLVGTIGRVLRLPENCLAGIINPRLLRISLDKTKADSCYFEYLLSSTTIAKSLARMSQGGTMGVLNAGTLKQINLLIPPLDEQQKIAQILSTWDKVITTTEQLLTNSQQQKKALMQQLLTGKKRLLDDNGQRFSGEWEELRLKKLFDFKRGKGLSKSAISESGKYKCILYGELFTYYPEVVFNVISKTNSDDSVLSISGDILIPGSTTTSGIDLANATALLEDDVFLGGDINILRPRNEVCSPFFAYLLTHIEKHQIASLAQGITIIHIYGADLKTLKVKIPKDIKEQQKIATVLTAADNEITRLQQKLDQLKQEKKALMQQLLTGKRRVQIN